MKDDVNIDKFIGIDSFEMSQPHLIDQTIKYVPKSVELKAWNLTLILIIPN